MADPPPLFPNEQEFIGCPYCTIQIPAGTAVCPHCRQVLGPPGKRPPVSWRGEGSDFRRILREQVKFTSFEKLWFRYGKWIKVAGPILAALLLLLLVNRIWVGYKVRVAPNPELPIAVKQERRDKAVLFKVTVTNKGEDIPDLSLKSVGVVMEFVYRDGRREKKTAFPKAEYHGEGALLHGESGSFEIEAPAAGLSEVVLRSQVFDLGMGQILIRPGGGRTVAPGRR